jgi:hypothetical protein
MSFYRTGQLFYNQEINGTCLFLAYSNTYQFRHIR